MITLRSDFSPALAGEDQEKENMDMLQMLLIFSGMDNQDIDFYLDDSAASCGAYNKALGEPNEKGIHSPEQWEAAKKAAEPMSERAQNVLIANGVTIENTLSKPEEEGYFACITTTVYSGYMESLLLARIERAITDIEAKSYEDNVSGYGFVNPDAIKFKTGSEK